MAWQFDIENFRHRSQMWGQSASGKIEQAMVEEYDRLVERLAQNENDADRKALDELRERMIKRMWTDSEELSRSDEHQGRFKGPLYTIRPNLKIVSENPSIDKKDIIDKTLDNITTPNITKEQWIEYLKSVGLFSDD